MGADTGTDTKLPEVSSALVTAGVSVGLFLLADSYLWEQVQGYYPSWAPVVFMVPWVMFLLYSLYLLSSCRYGRRGVRAAAIKAVVPYGVLMVPALTGLLNSSTTLPFALNRLGDGVAYTETPVVAMFGFESYCIYAAFAVMYLVRFIPYQSRAPQHGAMTG